MSEPKLLTKTELRERGWTHSQIKGLGIADGTVPTAERGRPPFGYKVSRVLAEERARTAAAE